MIARILVILAVFFALNLYSFTCQEAQAQGSSTTQCRYILVCDPSGYPCWYEWRCQ